MNISVVGSGYVGTTISACFADLGHNVVNIEIDDEIVRMINAGDAPIHEDGLEERIDAHAGLGRTARLRATTDYDAVADTDLTFMCLPTPSNDDGSIDLSVMEASAKSLGDALAGKDDTHMVVVKSTVVPGTTQELVAPTIAKVGDKTVGEDLLLGMNPEFLQMGTAVENFLHPQKIVFGTKDERVLVVLHEVFAPLLDATEAEAHIVETGIREAEMIKYANNAFLASKVSLINDIGNVCKELDVDAYEVADAIGLDDRIGERFLRSGLGWGGSCFPKDINAIIAAACEAGYEPPMLNAAVEINELQPRRLLSLLDAHVDVSGKRVAVLGLSFKPGTDDIRKTRAIPVIERLQDRGANVVAYDPVAMDNARGLFPDIGYANSAADALDGASACVVVTDWPEFSGLDAEFDQMKTPVIVDGRHCIKRRDGIIYEGLTW